MVISTQKVLIIVMMIMRTLLKFVRLLLPPLTRLEFSTQRRIWRMKAKMQRDHVRSVR
jgi:hypothetical protein